MAYKQEPGRGPAATFKNLSDEKLIKSDGPTAPIFKPKAQRQAERDAQKRKREAKKGTKSTKNKTGKYISSSYTDRADAELQSSGGGEVIQGVAKSLVTDPKTISGDKTTSNFTRSVLDASKNESASRKMLKEESLGKSDAGKDLYSVQKVAPEEGGSYGKQLGTSVFQVGKLRKDKTLSKVNKSEGRGDAYDYDIKRKVEIKNPLLQKENITEKVQAQYLDKSGNKKDLKGAEFSKNVGTKTATYKEPATYKFSKFKGKRGEGEKTKTLVSKSDLAFSGQSKDQIRSKTKGKVKFVNQKRIDKKLNKFLGYKSNKIGQFESRLAAGGGKGFLGKTAKDKGYTNTFESALDKLSSGTRAPSKIGSKKKKK